MVAADAGDAASLERAFAGATGAFCVTNFWEHFSPDTEVAQARNMARAAARADVKHVIWSTLEDTRQLVPVSDARMPTLMGRYKVPHFDGKGEADAVFAEEKAPTTLSPHLVLLGQLHLLRHGAEEGRLGAARLRPPDG